MNKKGQTIADFDLSPILLTFVFFIVFGVGLYLFWPIIEVFRVNLLDNVELDVLSKILLYGLRPIVWFTYVLVFVLSMRQAMLTQGLSGGGQE